MKNGTGNGKVTAEKQHEGKIKDPQKAIAAKAAELAALLDFSDITLGEQALATHQIYKPETYYLDDAGNEQQGYTEKPILGERHQNIVSILKRIAAGENGYSELADSKYFYLLHHLKIHIGDTMIDMAKVHFGLTPAEETKLQLQACCGSLHFDLLSLDSLNATDPKRFGEAKAFQEKINTAYERVKYLISKDGLQAYEQVHRNDPTYQADYPFLPV